MEINMKWVDVKTGGLPRPIKKYARRSVWVLVTNGQEWTPGQYEFASGRWLNENIILEKVTHWMLIVLPKPIQEGGN